MAFTTKQSDLTFDPCILKCANDIVQYTHEVAKKSAHSTSDLLVTAVWFCMNCACTQSSDKEGVKQTDHSKPDKPKTKTIQTVSSSNNVKEQIPEASTAINSSRENITPKKSFQTHVNIDQSDKNDQNLKQKRSVTSPPENVCIVDDTEENQMKGNDSHEKIVSYMDDMCCESKGLCTDKTNAKTEVPSEKKDQKKSDKNNEDNWDDMPDGDEAEIIVLDETEEEKAVKVTQCPESKEKSTVSKSGVLIEKANDENQADNNDYDYFDMDCDEIDEDEQFDTETSDRSKEQTDIDDLRKQPEQDDTEDITIISDDEDTNNETCSSNNKKDGMEEKQCNDAAQSSGKMSNRRKQSLSIKQENIEQPEIINLDSDSDSENENTGKTIKKIDKQKQKVSKTKKTTAKTKTASDGFIKEEKEDITCSKKLDDSDQGNDSLKTESSDAVKAKVLGLKPVVSESDVVPGKSVPKHAQKDNTVSYIQAESKSPFTKNISSGPSVFGLVPKNGQESVPIAQSITATSTTVDSQGPSSDAMTMEQGMSSYVQTSTAMGGSIEDIPPVKKRLLDFDKKWHKAPKLDRHHDRYLALPGGIEGNSVESPDDRQRKTATRKDTSNSKRASASKAHMECDTDTDDDASSSPVEHDGDDEESNTQESDKPNAMKGELKKGMRKTGKTSQGASTSKGKVQNKGQGKGKDIEKTKTIQDKSSGLEKLQRKKGISTGKQYSSSSSSQGSPRKDPGNMQKKKIGFYSVRRTAGEYQPSMLSGAASRKGCVVHSRAQMVTRLKTSGVRAALAKKAGNQE